MERNTNHHSVIDVPYWQIQERVFFRREVDGEELVDNVLYYMDWFKDHGGLNKPDERVVMGRDNQGILHVGTNYPDNITSGNSIENLRSLRSHQYKGISVHSLGLADCTRTFGSLLVALLRDNVISQEDIVEQRRGEFDYVYRRLATELARDVA